MNKALPWPLRRLQSHWKDRWAIRSDRLVNRSQIMSYIKFSKKTKVFCFVLLFCGWHTFQWFLNTFNNNWFLEKLNNKLCYQNTWVKISALHSQGRKIIAGKSPLISLASSHRCIRRASMDLMGGGIGKIHWTRCFSGFKDPTYGFVVKIDHKFRQFQFVWLLTNHQANRMGQRRMKKNKNRKAL